MKHRIRAAALAVALSAVAASPAAAHVTLQPGEVRAGGFTRLDVRVPNERDKAGTVKVEVRFPPGFASVSYEPRPGWTAEVKRRTAAEPIELHGEQVDEEIDTVVFQAAEGERIAPGQFMDFGLSLPVPDKPGTSLTFKAVQTYENGEVVRWIGAPEADEPAPQVKLVGAPGDGAAAEGASSQPEASPAAPASSSGGDGGDGGPSTGLVVAALALGGLGLLAGTAALLRGRPASAA
jgi:uncharacterized protein YcnI